VRPLNKCARSHQGALDRTQAKVCIVCGGVLVCTRAHSGSVLKCTAMLCSIALVQESVCVKIGPMSLTQCVWARA
jgi:hypothetical protein